MENNWLTPEKVQEELGIEKSQYYERLKELGIKAHRHKGKAYLDMDQVQRLRDRVSGQSAIATVDESSEIQLPINGQVDEVGSEEEEEDIWRKAAEIKAKHLTAKDLLTLHLAAGMNYEDLPPDLQEQVRQVSAATNPENLGKSIGSAATAILQKRRQK
jgi:hypothetical protein